MGKNPRRRLGTRLEIKVPIKLSGLKYLNSCRLGNARWEVPFRNCPRVVEGYSLIVFASDVHLLILHFFRNIIWLVGAGVFAQTSTKLCIGQTRSSLPADVNSPSPREASPGEGELSSAGRLDTLCSMFSCEQSTQLLGQLKRVTHWSWPCLSN